LLKQRKHKKFNYKTRFSKENEPNTNLDENFKENEFVSKWQRVRKINRPRSKRGISLRILIIILVLLLIGMYMLDF
jgi:hypothetical protein